MFTHSQLVDSLVAELLRPDLQDAMSNFLNQTIRELHFKDVNGDKVPVGYAPNLIEQSITANVDSGFTYDLPDPRLFQMMEAVYFTAVGRYATMRRPNMIREMSSRVDGAQYGWYRTGDAIAFDNYGGKNATIDLAWFAYVPRQQYYDAEDRPCEWDEATQDFTYHPNYDSTPELRLEAQSLCTNWMLQRWNDLLMLGVRAKTWARLNDTDRAKMAYSSYQQEKATIVNAETYDGAPRFRR